MLNRDDIELDVYSSTIIYGDGFANSTKGVYDQLFDRAKRMKNVNYMGYATNAGIRKAVQKAHIFAYPSIFQETSCISILQAMACGCLIISSNLGALKETIGHSYDLIDINLREFNTGKYIDNFVLKLKSRMMLSYDVKEVLREKFRE